MIENIQLKWPLGFLWTSQKELSKPNQFVFVPKPNQNITS